MNLTRAVRSLLADPRREFAGVLTVMFFAFAILGVQVLCSVHLDEADHGGKHVDVAVEQHAAPAAVGAPDEAVEAAPGHHDHGEDPNHCAEERTVTARYDRTASPATELAGVPDLAVQWLVPDLAQHAPLAPSGLAVAAAPSLHALGISRT